VLIDLQAEFGTAPAAEGGEGKNAAQLLFLIVYIQRSKEQVSLVTMSRPSPRTVAPPLCLPLDIKDLLKEDVRVFDGFFLMGDFDWLATDCL
jgi:hypothetical protein